MIEKTGVPAKTTNLRQVNDKLSPALGSTTGGVRTYPMRGAVIRKSLDHRGFTAVCHDGVLVKLHTPYFTIDVQALVSQLFLSQDI